MKFNTRTLSIIFTAISVVLHASDNNSTKKSTPILRAMQVPARTSLISSANILNEQEVTDLFDGYSLKKPYTKEEDSIDRLTAFLHPALAYKIRQESLPHSKKSDIPFSSISAIQQIPNISKPTFKERIDLLIRDMLPSIVRDTEKNIDEVIKKNKKINIAEKRMLITTCISKASLFGVASATKNAISNTMQQMTRAEEPRFVPFDPATIASLAGQAAKPLLIGGLIIGGVCYIEHIIRARDLNEIEHLKKDHEAEMQDLTKRMNHLAGLIKDAKSSMRSVTENVGELKKSYEDMRSLLISQIMPKITELLKQTSTKKSKKAGDLTTKLLTEELDNLKIELDSQKGSESDNAEENSTNISSQESHATKQPSLQGAAHKTWKIFFGTNNK